MKGVGRVKKALEKSAKTDFQQTVSTLLGDFLPGYWQTTPLGEFDRCGLDGFICDNETLSVRLAVQCKGFEKLDFGPSQEKQCIDEVEKYLKKGPLVEEYWLVVNRNIIDRQVRRNLESKLNDIVKFGKAKTVVLYDLSRFVNHLKTLAKQSIKSYAETALKSNIEYYNERLGFVNYIDQVPFTIGDEFKENPSSYLVLKITEFYASLTSGKTGNTRAAPRFIVKSGFGFGKTSALHAIAISWMNAGCFPILVPAARLGTQAFAHGSGITEALLDFLVPNEIELNKLSRDMFRDVLKNEIPKSHKWIILIDGLDENASIFKHTKIAAFWGGLFDLGVPVVISIRDEVADLRPAEMLNNPSERRAAPPQALNLKDWSSGLMMKFLERYRGGRQRELPETFGRLLEIMETGRYEEIYGDIPKRPLFLGMMAEDAASGISPDTKLHKLYGSYFRRKFQNDCFSPAAMGASNRYSTILDQLGLEEAGERLILVMQNAAAHMLSVSEYRAGDNPMMDITDDIAERDLLNCAEMSNLPITLMEDLTMHSLFLPAGRNRNSLERLYRFAHRSFQEWFIARHLAAEGATLTHETTPLISKFHHEMVHDLDLGLPLP